MEQLSGYGLIWLLARWPGRKSRKKRSGALFNLLFLARGVVFWLAALFQLAESLIYINGASVAQQD